MITRSALLGALPLVVVAVLGCTSTNPSVTPNPPSTGSAASPKATAAAIATAPALASSEPEGPPAWALGLEAQLQCDGPPQSTGGDLGDISDEGEGDSPQDALASLLGTGVWATFPAGGFEEPIGTEHWARHEYRHEGAIRAIAVTTDLEPWTLAVGTWAVVAIRACDSSEFDPADGVTFPETLWRDAAGKVVRSDLARAMQGPGHCDWGSTTWLTLGDRMFIRDPEGVLADLTVVPFEQRRDLPDDAVDTGLRTDQWHLYTVPVDDAVYVLTADGDVERWGRSRDPMLGCA